MVYTETQVINITKEYSFDGSEFKTKVWKQRGCLKPDRTLAALIEKLKTIYNVVEVTGSGKKRRYLLDDKKEVQTVREYNYKGTQLTEHDELMKEYIFNQLINHSNSSHSYKGWGIKFQLPNLINEEKTNIDYVKAVKNLYIKKDEGIFNANEIVSESMGSIYSRNTSIIKNSYKSLVKEGRIQVKTVYISSFVNDSKEVVIETISEEKYERVLASISELLKDYDCTYYEYIKYQHKNTGSEKIIKVTELIKEHLQSLYHVDRVYISYKVTVIDTTVLHNVTEEQFNNAYFSKLIKLSRDRQNRDKYKGSQTFWRRFYYLSMLLVLKSSHYNTEYIEKLFDEEYKKEETFIAFELGTFDDLFS